MQSKTTLQIYPLYSCFKVVLFVSGVYCTQLTVLYFHKNSPHQSSIINCPHKTVWARLLTPLWRKSKISSTRRLCCKMTSFTEKNTIPHFRCQNRKRLFKKTHTVVCCIVREYQALTVCVCAYSCVTSYGFPVIVSAGNQALISS